MAIFLWRLCHPILNIEQVKKFLKNYSIFYFFIFHTNWNLPKHFFPYHQHFFHDFPNFYSFFFFAIFAKWKAILHFSIWWLTDRIDLQNLLYTNFRSTVLFYFIFFIHTQFYQFLLFFSSIFLPIVCGLLGSLYFWSTIN